MTGISPPPATATTGAANRSDRALHVAEIAVFDTYRPKSRYSEAPIVSRHADEVRTRSESNPGR